MIKNIIRNFKKKYFRNGKKENFKEAIEDLIEEQEIVDDKLDDGTKKIFSNVIDIRNKCIEDIMVPRADIVAIPETVSFDELMNTMSKSKHSRIPTFSDNLDKITGMVHIRDFLSSIKDIERKEIKKKNVKEISRKILFSSPSMKILDLLLKMRSEKIHMAVVVDEFGGTDGLVTIEDILEEIVGEIEDETDIDEETQILQVSDNEYLVPALIDLDDFNDEFGSKFMADDFDTIGGVVLKEFARFPALNESVEINGYKFTVVSASRRQIKKLRVKIKD